jgi:excisionase family DNA binding protein
VPEREDKKTKTVSVAELRRRQTCSIDEAAALLGIGRSTAYAAARDGSLPTLRLSHRLLVPTAKLLAMIGAEQCVSNGQGA